MLRIELDSSTARPWLHHNRPGGHSAATEASAGSSAAVGVAAITAGGSTQPIVSHGTLTVGAALEAFGAQHGEPQLRSGVGSPPLPSSSVDVLSSACCCVPHSLQQVARAGPAVQSALASRLVRFVDQPSRQ